MKNKITIPGRVQFDPPDMTNKHKRQASWKKMILFNIDGELCEYYAWFIKKRYNLTLNPPLRRAHFTVVNDASREISGDWEAVKKMYDGLPVEITYDLDKIRTDSKHWWIDCTSNEAIAIRSALGLGKPHWRFHITIGHANEKNIQHSNYIHSLVKRFGGNYN